ncbi:MAG: glycosyltransferase [Lachnospiraceae bacterium]|nr:glycosyltransferase [Lachnospiraceae bacterium]
MKVSIIVPVYNVEKYIKQCIDSILEQTFTDIELIIVDDGTKDDSGKIADEYAAKNPKVSVIHKENGGLASARNAGIRMAEGDYICFIDSDDWVEKDYLEKLYNSCVQNDLDIAICGYFRRCDGKDISGTTDGRDGLQILEGRDVISGLYTENYVRTVVAWNKLYKRSLFDDLLYTEGMIHEDEAICAMLLYKAKKVGILPDKLYNYRVDNTSSIMGEKYSLKHLDMLGALEMRMDFFKEKELKEYYENDSFKYMYKILLNITDIKKSTDIEDKRAVIRDIKGRYWRKYREALHFNWSVKRKTGMLVCGLFPRLYMLRYKR